jgi:hypothetical protein
MANFWTVATVGILTTAGAALGIHLGNTSVSEIDPIYFQKPETRFHSDLSPYRREASGNYVAWTDNAGRAELGTGCVGCRTYPEEYFPQRDAIIESAVEGVPEETPAVELAVAETMPDADLVERQADPDRLQRYARFSVTAEDAPPAYAPTDSEASAIQGDEVAAAD